MNAQPHRTFPRHPRQRPPALKPSCDPTANWPATLKDLEVLRQQITMPLRAADGWPMEHDTLGCIIERAFLRRCHER